MEEQEKLMKLNIIKEELYMLYPNAVKIKLDVEGDKIKITPEEKYEINAGE